ncbi:hypothetical protein N7507_006899 [Penicillium longicatenatum]|nr:hypothetical protein N7507_006899 [Penicillium longicatenatum]
MSFGNHHAEPHLAIIGSLNIDFVTTTPRCPQAGETLTATSLTITAGGKGGNQAVAAGRASFVSPGKQHGSVRMIGAVRANDPNYKALLEPTLRASGVCTKGITLLSDFHAQTGSATIIVEEDGGENRILVVPGANHTGMMDVDRIHWSIMEPTTMPLPQVLVLQGEIPRSTTLWALEYFNRAEGLPHVVFNPAPVFPEGISLEAIMGTSVLIMNETEAVQMSRSIAGFPISGSAESAEVDGLKPEELASRFHMLARVQVVIITLGAKGVYFSTKSGRSGSVEGVKVGRVVDTTAAGDTLVGYFSTAFARFVATGAILEEFDDEIETVVRKANLAAAVCVQRQGAMLSIPFAYELA